MVSKVTDKILLSFDVKMPDGLIYNHQVAQDLMILLLKNKFGGVILPKNYKPEDYNKIDKPQFYISNPKMVLEDDIMSMVCDVEFEDNVEIPTTYWRLVIAGNGEIEDGQVLSITEILSINIEIVDEIVYNELIKKVRTDGSN